MKNGSIKIRDIHYLDDGTSESGELQANCTIETDGSQILVRYSEKLDETLKSDVSLVIKKDCLTMIREGKMSTSMVFKNKERYVCYYETPFGELSMGVYTNAMFIDFNEEGGVIDLAYTLDSNGDLLHENELKIIVEAEEEDYVSFG